MHDTLVELEGVNGEYFDLTNGDQGVWLASDVKGLYDPPVKVVYEEPGNFPGARYLNARIMRRDITFAVHILNDTHLGGDSWMSRDSEWRKAWAFDRDAFLRITTAESGTRALKVRLGESPDISFKVNPNDLTLNTALMTVIAGDPFWYEDDVVYEAVTKTDTSFNPVLGNFVSFDQLNKETLTIKVDPSDGKGGLNPTDQYIWRKWTVPGSTQPIPSFPFPFPPGIAIPWDTAPFTMIQLPDNSYENPDQAIRQIRLPGLIYKENCVVDTDPRVEQVSSEIGTQVWARMNGVRFRNPVPPYTKSDTYTITVAGCPLGQMITLRIPRPWTRPWGLE